MHPEQLERLVAFLEARPGTAMVYADYVAIDERGAPLSDPTFRPDDRRPATSPEVHLPRDPAPSTWSATTSSAPASSTAARWGG